MKLRDIFKMELFKNRNDKAYVLIIGILMAMTALSTFLGIGLIEGTFNANQTNFMTIFILLMVFSVIGLWAFSLLYPFRLLNVDYNNKVMGLIFASGVSREKYYFVKVGATLLSCIIATFLILFIPAVTFLTVYTEEFVIAMQNIFGAFSLGDIFPFLLMGVFTIIAYYVTLTTAVITTKGKIVGILLFFGFSFTASIVESLVGIPVLSSTNTASGSLTNVYYLKTIFAILQIVAFGFMGLQILKKQDL
jgi:ABC-type transport system involved in multi-copper enzyme maturation permease subunit